MRSDAAQQATSPEGADDRSVISAIKINSIITRMKKAYEVSSDNELATSLGIAKTTISSWRRRNSIPIDFIIKTAVECYSSIDYIVFGKEYEMRPGIYDIGIDVGLMEICMYVTDSQKIGSHISDEFEKSSFRARNLLLYYSRGYALLREATERGVSSREEFLKSLRKTFDIFSPLEAAPPDEEPPATAEQSSEKEGA